MIAMAPLAKWCNAVYVEKRLSKIHANEDRLEFEDGTFLDYDVLALNIGSRDAQEVSGVYEYSMTTEPIN